MGLRNLTWLQSPISRFYSVPAVLDKPCAYRLTTPFCLRAIVLQQADTCFAKGLAGTVSRRVELRAGQWCCRWCICCLLIRAVFHLSMRGAVGKIIHGHSGKRFLPWCTGCFLICTCSVCICGVSPGLFAKTVGSQARQNHCLFLWHKGSADTWEMAQSQMR